jgi:hypothetical protein
MRYLPSTTSASLDNACRLSRVRVLARFFSARLTSLAWALPRAWTFPAATMSSCARWAYQMSMVRIPANSAIASRYAATAAVAAARASAFRKPLLRPAIVKLAASRFTSYSKGPGRVSSKSLRSNRSRRSGEAYAPKLDRCASPHSCTESPAVGVSFRSAAMILAAPR